MEYDESILVQRRDDAEFTGGLHKRQLTLHCAKCNTVLGDSGGVCGEIKCMDSIICSRVTSDVVICDAMESGHTGELANCIYSALQCYTCRSAVGQVIHSAPLHLATIRSLFLFCKANINCYILDSNSMLKASALTFDLRPLNDSIDEVKHHFKVHLDWMSSIKSRLADRSVTNKLDK